MCAVTLFTDGWTFLKTDLETTWEEMNARRGEFRPVELPHDWLIYNTLDLYENSCGWYRNSILQEEIPAGERMQLRFDGVYMDSTLYVNGQKVGDWKYGYSTFDMDITDFLQKGRNEVTVQVRFQSPNSRWYSGAGIYRNVWLKRCGRVYLPFDGTYVSIKPCENQPDRGAVPGGGTGSFLLEAQTEVAGDFSSRTGCHFTLWKDGKQVQDLGWQYCRANAGECHRKMPNLANEKAVEGSLTKICVKAVIERPALWEIESPQCYQLVVELFDGKQKAEEQRITVGFRTMEFDSDKGFFLNGKNVKVHGVCEHHDFGCLGAAYSQAAMERKFRILRGMGVNAIRTSHNMPAPELMELADRMGFLVMNEAFDMWECCKTPYDYGRFFKEWAEKDVASWIRRDRNHPSLFLWSIGNEIYDTHADEHGQEITRRLIGYVREHDPKENARITIGSNYMPWENARKCADIVKLAGYNYGEKYYDEHHREHPDWIIYGSETASIVQSRGIYHFPLAQSILADEDEQCSALGNSSTSWGARSIEKCITDDRDAEFAFGQFLWTGFDYIGEPTPYHTKNSYFGQIDTAGFPKDAYYIFKAAWTDMEKEPMVHLFPYWDFNEGQLIDVRACTNAPFVELYVNGRSMGRQEIDHAHGKKLLGDWQVAYEPGTITAVAYDREGKEVARQSRHSFGDSRRLLLTADKAELRADKKDLCFVTIQTLDEEGNPVENAADYVNVSVKGAGRLLGLDNGDSTDYDPYKGNRRKLFSGKLLAVIGSTHEAGKIEVTVSGEHLPSESVVLTAVCVGEKPGLFLDDCMLYAGEEGNKAKQEGCKADSMVPVRKVELSAPQGLVLTPDKKEVLIHAQIYPSDATHKGLIWKAVNDSGIDVSFAKVEELESRGNYHTARVTASGDGEFRIRCMAGKDGERVTVISQIECRAEGLGQAFLNPYELISAGLYTDTVGEIGNGNEKGIATARDAVSGVIFENVNFGEYGSDEITMPIFALSGDEYPIDIWLGRPYEENSRLIDTVIYQKPSRWNTYQEETWKLSERISGVVTLAFVLRAKAHIKGFRFRYFEKAFGRLYAKDASKIYGDSFERKGSRVENIGNNVTLEYENMDFGSCGTEEIVICGRTNLAANTIHIHFTPEGGDTIVRMVEFMGTDTPDYGTQRFAIEKIQGKGKLELIFLPGSHFDMEYFHFQGCR